MPIPENQLYNVIFSLNSEMYEIWIPPYKDNEFALVMTAPGPPLETYTLHATSIHAVHLRSLITVKSR